MALHHSLSMDRYGLCWRTQPSVMGTGMMRLLAGLATALGCCVATSAMAQAAPHSSVDRLMDAAFAPDLQPQRAEADDLSRLLDREAYREGAGPVRWNTNQFKLKSPSGAIDTVRVSLGGTLRTPGGVPLDIERAAFEADAYEVNVTRDWPSAVSFEAGRYNLDVTPHAGVGVSNIGGQAEAGATLTLGQRTSDAALARLRDMGVQDGGMFGNAGRWYLFAAASGQAVGMNVLRTNGDWNRAGWTTDASSQLIGDAQVGVGWRKGPMQTSFGYIHREVKGEHMVFGQQTKEDSMVAFSLSIKPQH